MTDFRFSLRMLLLLMAWLALCMGVVSAGFRSGGAELAMSFAVLILLGGGLGLLLTPNIRGVWLGSMIPASAFCFGVLLDVASRWWAG